MQREPRDYPRANLLRCKGIILCETWRRSGKRMDIEEKRKSLLKAWETFQKTGEIGGNIIRGPILQSWRRCKAYGINPETGNRKRLPAEELAALLQANSLLLHVARGIMEKLYNPIILSDSIISISDANGVILECLRDNEKNYPMPNIEPGSISLENSSGTNAINLCLQELKAVETFGAEHYCQALHGWFCSAAPVWNTHDELIGVLNVTLPWSMFHSHTRGMVEAAAFAITEQMRLNCLLAEQQAIFEMMDEGLIIIDERGNIQAINKKAQQMLFISHHNKATNINEIILSPDILTALLSHKSCFTDQEAMLKLRTGTLNCMLSVANAVKGKNRIITMREIKRMKQSLARVVGAKAVFTFEHIVGHAHNLQETVKLAQRAAKSDATTLILGESGTGKELFAQSIHNASQRAKEAFVTVNCGALPRELVQSELFGYDEGAFTGASHKGKPGKFELADNGTIFLDEIGEMPMEVQVSLLRLLQDGELTRVGGKYTRHVNVRVIAATNRDLQKAILQNTFRGDLYWRLNVFSLHVPSLRQRPGDVAILIEHFLAYFRRSQNRMELDITPAAKHILESYDWPGNVRELENMIERLTYMAPDSGLIDIDILPEQILMREAPKRERELKDGLLIQKERESILKILQECNGNIRACALKLGISRSGLYMKLKRFGINVGKYR